MIKKILLLCVAVFTISNIAICDDLDSKNLKSEENTQDLQNPKDSQSTQNLQNIEFKSQKTTKNLSEIIESIRILTQPESSEIISVENTSNGVLAHFSSVSLLPGESGIVLRDLGAYQVLVGNIEVLDVKGGSASGKISDLGQFAQPYLPTPRLTPKIGDKVIFRNFNNKAFLIAPNEESYKLISGQFGFLEFVNADLLMGFLNSQGKHDPTKKNLIAACNEYAVGLVFIVGSKSVGIFSCENVKMIEKYDFSVPNASTFSSPFFTRVKFDGGGSLTYLFASKKSKEYYNFYDEILGDLIFK